MLQGTFFESGVIIQTGAVSVLLRLQCADRLPRDHVKMQILLQWVQVWPHVLHF